MAHDLYILVILPLIMLVGSLLLLGAWLAFNIPAAHWLTCDECGVSSNEYRFRRNVARRSKSTLRRMASRDGWSTKPSGDFCPAHSAADAEDQTAAVR